MLRDGVKKEVKLRDIVPGDMAVVVRTGGFTEYGKIAKRLTDTMPETEFERGIKGFGFLIMQVTILLVLFVFITSKTCSGAATAST